MTRLVIVRDAFVAGVDKETDRAVTMVVVGQNNVCQQTNVGKQQEVYRYLLSHLRVVSGLQR